MATLVEQVPTTHSPESLATLLRQKRAPGVVLLRSACFEIPEARYSFVAANPFQSLRARGSCCELSGPTVPRIVHFGNPWRLLEALLARYELLDEIDLPFPLGAAFGYWGYGLRRFVEPRLGAGPVDDLEIPDSVVGFHDSLVVFDHHTGQTWVVSTGILPDGSRDETSARRAADRWHRLLRTPPGPVVEAQPLPLRPVEPAPPPESSLGPDGFRAAVRQALEYIRTGHIYQVNLAQRFEAVIREDAWALFQELFSASPSPFGAFLDFGDFQLASISPELFLRLSGAHILTRPIKGTRPRSPDPTCDAQLAYELQTSPKELAELLMITDLLRNDLGRVCEYGTVQVPEFLRLEKYAHVQHLVSTVEGRLRPDVTHLAALEAAFPGGSITGAPKVRAMEIIDELEPVARGPYTGSAGYLGFNRESQFNILIRTAVIQGDHAWYHAGAGIVADSDPDAEYRETVAKARAFLDATSDTRSAGRLTRTQASPPRNPPRSAQPPPSP
ncbi:MAG: aminodeoxychorismate synthase component I [Limisphaerales bacterium]